MNYQLTIILLFFTVFYSFGQTDSVILKGKVLEFEKPIPDVHLYNLNSLNATSTSTEGKFDILVNLNDAIIVSHIKYHTLRVLITEKYLNKDSIIIYMQEMTNKLDTIHIKNHDLTGSLSLDSKNAPQIRNMDSMYTNFKNLAKQRSFKNYGRDFERPPMNNVDPTGGAGVGGAAGIPFRFRDLEIRRELRSKRNFPKQIIAEMGLPYFTHNLKIPEEKIHHFLSYCEHREIMKLYQKNEIMKVLTILQKESVEYLKIEE